MNNKSIYLLLFALACVTVLASQTTVQDFSFQVSAERAWTDTGLDLQSGDTLQITALPGGSCDPAGTGATGSDLPFPSAAAGTLLARLHAQGAAPLRVGASARLKIEEASHLYLGLNYAGLNGACDGAVSVKVHRTPEGSAENSSDDQNRGEHLKSQLESAAQVFMSGQFGMGKSESNSSSGTDAASNPAPLTVSNTPLDAGLRKDLDSLPRRVNDQFQNLGDMVNFAIIGSEKDVQAALDAANWHVADTGNRKAVLDAVEETYENKDYLQMPMSTLYLFGRKQDFGYEMAEPIAMVASRHHFRIWKAPFSWNGKEVWVGAGTHDIGFAKDKRNGSVTHKIDPAVDGERDNIGSSLQKAKQVKSLTYYLPANPVQEAKNATGDGYHSDGRMIVIFLQ